MSTKVNNYLQTTSVYSTSGTTTISDIPSEESFEEVLVLNQAALKAMTIDAMVAKSSTGSVNPDAVDAAAIMSFRNTLGSNIVAPIPQDDWDGGSPQKAKLTGKNNNTTPDTTPNTSNIDTSDVYNEGNLKCSDELNAYFKEAAEKYNVDVKLLKSIAFVESGFNPSAVSNAGAMGIMQLMPAAASDYGVSKPFDARQNIMGGANLISTLLERYNGDTSLALAAYNAGPGNVDKANGIPFESTKKYVEKVLGYYNS